MGMIDLVLTVHDELVIDCPEWIDAKILEEACIKPISWALDLPLAVESKEGKRYKK